MPYCFNNDKSKYDLTNKFLNWQKLGSMTRKTLTLTAGGTAVDTYIGSTSDWRYLSDWQGYDIIRVSFIVTQVTFERRDTLTDNSRVTLTSGGNSPVTFQMSDEDSTYTLNTGTAGYKIFTSYFRKGSTVVDSNDDYTYSYYNMAGTAVDPSTDARPLVTCESCQNGTMTVQVWIEGCDMNLVSY